MIDRDTFIKLAQQALVALYATELFAWHESYPAAEVASAITALKQALAEQDSVAAWENKYEMNKWQVHAIRAGWMPAPTPRKPLTDEEIFKICQSFRLGYTDQDLVRAIERHHGIGEQT